MFVHLHHSNPTAALPYPPRHVFNSSLKRCQYGRCVRAPGRGRRRPVPGLRGHGRHSRAQAQAWWVRVRVGVGSVGGQGQREYGG